MGNEAWEQITQKQFPQVTFEDIGLGNDGHNDW